LTYSETYLAPYLAYMFSLSFEVGIFPVTLKIAAVMPIYKANNKYDVANYRPISILLCLSKILEEIIKKRVFNFLEKYNVVYPHQYGLCPKDSTIHAILDITITLHDLLNNKKKTCLVTIDL